MDKEQTKKKSIDGSIQLAASSSFLPACSSIPMAAAESQQSHTVPESQSKIEQVSEQSKRCQETGETSFCDNPPCSKNTRLVDSEVTEDRNSELPISFPQREKLNPNEMDEANFSDDYEEDEGNQFEAESSNDEAPTMRLRRHGDFDSEDEDANDYCTESNSSQSAGEKGSIASADDSSAALEKTKDEKEKKQSSIQVDRRDPTYVPREGAFYLHDARDESHDGNDDAVSAASDSAATSSRRPGMLNTRWAHDLYVEQQQYPRTTKEILRRYGVDIRNFDHDPAPQEKPRHVDRGGTKRGQRRGRGLRSANTRGDTADFSRADFPRLENRENLRNQNQSRGWYSKGTKRGGDPSRYFEVKDNVAASHAVSESCEDVVKRNPPITRRSRRGRSFGVHGEDVMMEELKKLRIGRNRGNDRMPFGVEGTTKYVPLHNSNIQRTAPEPPSPVVLAGMPKSPNSFQHPQSKLPFQAPRAGKRYSMIRRTHNSEPPQSNCEVGFATPMLPESEMRRFYRSVDPSIVAALVQQHQMENPEAFEASKAASLSMLEECELGAGN